MMRIPNNGVAHQVQESALVYGESVFSAASALVKKETRQLSDAELLAILFGISQTDALAWLHQVGSLRKVVESSTMGKALMEFASRYLFEKARCGEVLEDPDAVRLYLAAKLRDRSSEVFAAVFLDNRHRVIAYEELFFG